jgi:hypothetical protein
MSAAANVPGQAGAGQALLYSCGSSPPSFVRVAVTRAEKDLVLVKPRTKRYFCFPRVSSGSGDLAPSDASHSTEDSRRSQETT